MVFQPGHQLSVGNGGGRKTRAVEFAGVLKKELEKITDQVLIQLANKRIHEHIDKPLNKKDAKDLALPIVLRGMAEKHVNIEMTLEQLLEQNLKRKNSQD
jgi:hypothetical protein